MTITYTDRSNARRAALKQGLENAEFTLKQNGKGRWEIVIIDALRPQACAATPADQGIAAAKDDDAEAAAAAKPAAAPAMRESNDEDLRLQALNIFAIKRPSARHIDALRAADRGILPEAPALDFKEAEFYRRTLLGKAREMIAAKDIDGLLDFMTKIIPGDSVRRPIRAYGLLAARALRAQR